MANNWGQSGGWGSSPTQTSTPATPEGLTPKQQDMSNARNPMNNNNQNEVSAQAASDQTQPQQRPVEKQQIATDPLSVRIQQSLGTYALQVQAQVNKYLKGNTNTSLGQTGQYGTTFSNGTFQTTGSFDTDSSGFADAKIAQRNEMANEFGDKFFEKNPTTGEYTARDFRDIVKEDTGIGADPRVDGLLNIVEKINNLEAMGNGQSAEAQALRQQLKRDDVGGIVTGLYQAKQDYERMLGVADDDKYNQSWSGESGEAFTLQDFLNMSDSDIKDQVEKAKSSQGIFSDTYSSSVKKQADEESKVAMEAAARNKKLNEDLFNSGKEYFTKTQKDFKGEWDKLNGALKEVSSSIFDDLKKDPNNKAAVQWFSNQFGGDPVKGLMNAIYDEKSGMSVEQRKTLKGYIGDMMGGSSGKIVGWLTSLQNTGKLTFDDVNGNEVTFEPTAEEKLSIIQAPDKGVAFQTIINSRHFGDGINNALANIRSGDLTKGIDVLKESFKTSMATFINSSTETAVRKYIGIPDDKWNSLGKEQQQQLLTDTLTKNPKIGEKAVNSAAEAQKKIVDGQVAAQKARVAEQVNRVNQEKAAVEQKIGSITTIFSKLVNDKNIAQYRPSEMAALKAKLNGQLSNLNMYKKSLDDRNIALEKTGQDIEILAQKISEGINFDSSDVANYSLAVGRLAQQGKSITDESIQAELAVMGKEKIAASGNYLNMGGGANVQSASDAFNEGLKGFSRDIGTTTADINTSSAERAKDFGGEVETLGNSTRNDLRTFVENTTNDARKIISDTSILPTQKLWPKGANFDQAKARVAHNLDNAYAAKIYDVRKLAAEILNLKKSIPAGTDTAEKYGEIKAKNDVLLRLMTEAKQQYQQIETAIKDAVITKPPPKAVATPKAPPMPTERDRGRNR